MSWSSRIPDSQVSRGPKPLDLDDSHTMDLRDAHKLGTFHWAWSDTHERGLDQHDTSNRHWLAVTPWYDRVPSQRRSPGCGRSPQDPSRWLNLVRTYCCSQLVLLKKVVMYGRYWVAPIEHLNRNRKCYWDGH